MWVVTVGAAAPAAAAEPSTYSISAARSASVDITLSRPVVLDMSRTTVKGSGSFAGYYLQPLAGDPLGGAGVLVFNGVAVGKFAPAPVPLGNASAVLSYSPKERRNLAAGRYRVHVLADAPTVVRLGLRGAGTSRALRATVSSRFAASVRDATPRGAVETGPVASADVPLAIASKRSLTVLMLFVAYRAPTPGATRVYRTCLGPPEVAALCQAGPSVPGNARPDDEYGSLREDITSPVPGATGGLTYAVYYRDGSDVAGERTASYLAGVSGVLDRFVVGAFSLAY